jgi:hypothetical protein
LCGRLNLSKLRVPWDIDIHWNSTYRMLCRILPYKYAISQTICNSSEGLSLLYSTGEWDQLEQLHTFLEVFFNATVQLSCSYTPPAHQLLQHLYLIFKVCFLFVFIFISLEILSYFITNLFYFFQGVPWFGGYRFSSNRRGCARWLSSITDYRSHER